MALPGPTSAKNEGLAAASDLGLGAQLEQQTADQVEEMKKRKLMAAAPGAAGVDPGGVMGMGNASTMLFQ